MCLPLTPTRLTAGLGTKGVPTITVAIDSPRFWFPRSYDSAVEINIQLLDQAKYPIFVHFGHYTTNKNAIQIKKHYKEFTKKQQAHYLITLYWFIDAKNQHTASNKII